jgi:hypothetical protein
MRGAGPEEMRRVPILAGKDVENKSASEPEKHLLAAFQTFFKMQSLPHKRNPPGFLLEDPKFPAMPLVLHSQIQ